MTGDSPSPSMRARLLAILESLGTDPASREWRLNSILEDFYSRMGRDDMLGFFFIGRNLVHIAHQQGKFLLNAAGLTSRFNGKGPSTAHVALPPILSGHFDRRLVLLGETLRAHGLSPEVVAAWVDFENSFREMIVSS